MKQRSPKVQAVCRRAALLVVMLLNMGCGDRKGVIRIGAAGAFTYVPDNLRGIFLAIDDANKAGGVYGRRLEIVVGDDHAAGDEAARIAERFVKDRSIVAVVGHSSTAATLAAARVYDGHLAAVATTATSPELTNISPWVFRVAPSDQTQGADLARFVLDQGWRRVAILYRNGVWGRGLASAFQGALARGGGETISADPVFDNATDFNVFLRTYARSKPDAVLALSSPQSAGAFLHQAVAHRLSAHIIGGDGWPGRLASDPAANGVFILSAFFPGDTTAVATRFRTHFRARYGHDPDAMAALGYDAAIAVIAALRHGGADRVGVRHALASRRGILVHGATGPISFASGDRVEKVGGMLRVADGRLTSYLRWANVAKQP